MHFRTSLELALRLSLLTVAVSAAPALRERQTLTTKTVKDFTAEAIAMFLSTHQADTQPFNIKGSWASINFAGDAAEHMTPAHINYDIYSTCDQQLDRTNNMTVSFSQSYKHFIQTVANTTGTLYPTQQMNDTSTQMRTACWTDFAKVLNEGLQAYNGLATVPATNKSDPAFLEWANNQDPDYMQAHMSCQQAQLAYYNAVNTAYGDDAGIYIGAANNIKPLSNLNEVVPGITMQTSDPSSQIGGGPDSNDGACVAAYSIPTLNTTLTSWQAGSGLANFQFNSATYNASSSSSTKFGGASFGISYDGVGVSASAQHSESTSSADLTALSMELSFGALALLEVDQGFWFDNYQVARAAQNPDAKHAAAKDVFSSQTFFGSAATPGPLSVYNSQALVGFKPSWTIALADSHTSSSSSSTEAGGGVSILGILNLGGYGGNTKNTTHYDNATNTLTVQDDSNNAYIIGFIQNTFWNSGV
ncbi:hypothetical protein DFH09DRAFT_1425759 [Mycena vulgaris]|nr:hypothetical protein DFH09DRAFT_1425759 [Mycena vulgaris]